jgi:hypothetical protein
MVMISELSTRTQLPQALALGRGLLFLRRD